VSLGVIAGSVLIYVAAIGVGNTTQFRGTGVGALTPGEIVLLCGYAVVMLGVCALACVVPTVRALRVQPTEALRAE
jgi:ABC-type lipoprotein release transport system permease subunit